MGQSDLYGYLITEERYEDESLILKEGNKGGWIYLILEGRVKLVKKTSRGNVILDTLKKGDVFGEVDFLDGGKGLRSLSVKATDGPVRVGVLNTERLVKDYEATPPQLRILIKSFMKKYKETMNNACTAIGQ